MSPPADLVIVGVRAVTLDPYRPSASSIAVRGERILAVGTEAEIHPSIGPHTSVLDGRGAVVVPAFHDAHCHFLAYARSRAWIDCSRAQSIAEIAEALRAGAAATPPGQWIRGYRFDDAMLADGRAPDRRDLDAAVPDRPVRLQHRSLHLDVLNSMALRALGLAELMDTRIERVWPSGEPTGRIYHGGDLLRRNRPHAALEDLAADVRAASERLLSRGITTVQDATVTNGPEEWTLLLRLARRGDLRLRVFMMWGATHQDERAMAEDAAELVRAGPVKVMVHEGISDPRQVRADVAAAAGAGHPVALHAVSEAEVAIALDALRDAPRCRQGPHRIEHGAVLCDEWLDDLRAMDLMVVGQPSLVYERGDVYREAYPPECHGWLHRARSLVDRGIGYAAGSDAPVTEPDPLAGIAAARTRATRSGGMLGLDEALGMEEAVAAFTRGPARSVGVEGELGVLRAGARADIAVLDPDALDAAAAWRSAGGVRATIMNGKLVWQRG